ncbi:unnamed protein product [Clavelina lepadiformis]|uniref:Uncharacterized protein n=1 Tax=Clavelina lepadiformis TaxID=159417 RepID=A0ABP0F138_CLALP
METGFAMECPLHSKYEGCATGCPNTCASPFASSDCDVFFPVEDCVCEIGYMRDGKKCIPTSECGTVDGDGNYINKEELMVPEKAHCRISGDPHYTTFDGKRYDFMGECSYTLVDSPETDDCPKFVIEGINGYRHGRTSVSYLEEVVVRIGNNPPIVLNSGKKITVGKKPYNLGSHLFDKSVVMYKSGRDILFKSTFGLTFRYRDAFLKITLPKKFSSLVDGLCGNFDGKPEVIEGPNQFANPFQTDTKPGSCPELNMPTEGPPPKIRCLCKEPTEEPPVCPPAKQTEFAELCSILKDDNKCFESCTLDPTPYFEDCVYDACAFDEIRDSLEQNVAAYATACQREGHDVCNWREMTETPLLCPANSHYELRTPMCPETCVNPDKTQITCNETGFVEGCLCNDGFILSDEECVPLSECGCLVETEKEISYYKNGQAFYTDDTCTNKCTCKDTAITCANSPCEECEECDAEQGLCVLPSYDVPGGEEIGTAWGDPHYLTFDGAGWLDFYGVCSYTLVETHKIDRDNSKWIHVISRNERRHGNDVVSYVRDLTVKLGKLTIQMEKNGVIKINGKVVQEYISPDVTVSPSGTNIILKTKHGVHVTFDGVYTARVRLPCTYRNKVRGLFGDFNGDASNELIKKNGEIAADYNEMASSYQVGDCANTDTPSFTCSPEDEAKWAAEEYCGMLTKADGAFAECHSLIDTTSFAEKCAIDLCANNGDPNILKEIVTSYASECQRRGVKLCNWRMETGFAMECPPHSKYEGCATGCPNTCASPFASSDCDVFFPVEDCVCDIGYIRDGKKCIPTSECGKIDGDGNYVSEGPASLPELNHCTGSGDPHYTTFDGKRYDFQGICSYMLVQSANSSLNIFEIEVENEHRGGKKHVSFLKKMIINIRGLPTIELLKGRQIKIGGKLINKDYVNAKAGVSVTLTPSLIVLKTSFGLQVEYDGDHYFKVTLPKSYAENVKGLCGDLNGSPDDDCKDLSGNEILSPNEFAVQYATDTSPECRAPIPPTPADCPNKDEFEAHCSIMTDRDGCFKECQSFVNPEGFYSDCVFDACAFGDHYDALEQNLKAYAKACQDAGASICNWRNETGLTVTCPSKSHYEMCGSRCPARCGNADITACDDRCEEGCVCDDGFILSGEDCIPESECGCMRELFYYKTGESYFTDETCQALCTCQPGGEFTCMASQCEPGEVCAENNAGHIACIPGGEAEGVASGDPHYKTFDGNRWYDFMGICTYTLVETHRLEQSDKRWFVIEAQNEHRHGHTHVSYLKYVTVRLQNDMLEVRMDKGPQFSVNGKPTIAYTSPTLTIHKSGFSTILKTTYGLQVVFDGNTATVKISSVYRTKVRGLLGNYDDNPANDLETKTGEVVTDYNQVAESYVVGSCGTATPALFICSDKDTAIYERHDSCGAITNPDGPFKDCHDVVDPDAFARTCVFDVCATDGSSDTLREALEGYVTQCQQNGVRLCNWRLDMGIAEPSCPENSHYDGCATLCPDSCANPFATATCDTDGTVEGCVCDYGYIKESNKCIRKSECRALIDGAYLAQEHPAKSCQDILAAGYTESGVYPIFPIGIPEGLRIYCDMETDGGGWMVFQRRMDGSVDFRRNWQAYIEGFGQLEGEFWLGLDKLNRLFGDFVTELRVDLEDFENNKRFAKYEMFTVGSADTDYQLMVSGYADGDAGDGMGPLSGMKFSTIDRKNDIAENTHCSDRYNGGWWYKACYVGASNLNGKYLRGAHKNEGGVDWLPWRVNYSLKFVEMKIRYGR